MICHSHSPCMHVKCHACVWHTPCTYVHTALPSLLSHTYHLAGTRRLSFLRHSLAQMRAASCSSTSKPHVQSQASGREHKWFPSSPLPSRAVHPNLVSAIPAWCSESLHPPQCQELLLSNLHTQLCSSPLPARCWRVPTWQKQHLSSAACLGRGRGSVRVGFMCWHSSE